MRLQTHQILPGQCQIVDPQRRHVVSVNKKCAQLRTYKDVSHIIEHEVQHSFKAICQPNNDVWGLIRKVKLKWR